MRTDINFYDNGKFIFYCKVGNDSDYKNFIDTLVKITENNELLEHITKYHAKRKLIK